MSRWTYYSPLVVGMIVVLVFNQQVITSLATRWNLNHPWQQYVAVSLIALQIGLLAQAVMIGFQGAFAQVLPVPGGRSIRGESAVRAGWLLLLSLALWITGGVLRVQELGLASLIVAGAAALAIVTSAIIYVWNIPAALNDFPAAD